MGGWVEGRKEGKNVCVCVCVCSGHVWMDGWMDGWMYICMYVWLSSQSIKVRLFVCTVGIGVAVLLTINAKTPSDITIDNVQ